MLIDLLKRQYFKGIQMKLDPTQVKMIRSRFEQIMLDSEEWLIDKPSVINLTMCALVLATYEVLQQQQIKNWREIIKFALAERTMNKQRMIMKWVLKLSRNPFGLVVRISKTKQVKHYGDKQFTHEILADTNQEFKFHIHKCFYYNFFSAHGVPEITSLFCELDAVWGDLLQSANKYGVTFDRPATLAWGHSRCEFNFVNTKNG